MTLIYRLSIYWYPDTSRWLPTDSTKGPSLRGWQRHYTLPDDEKNEPGENVENNGDFTKRNGDFMGKMLVNAGKASFGMVISWDFIKELWINGRNDGRNAGLSTHGDFHWIYPTNIFFLPEWTRWLPVSPTRIEESTNQNGDMMGCFMRTISGPTIGKP